jgi:hypothetical protein
MANDATIPWALFSICVLAGVGFLMAKVDDAQAQKLESLNRFFPAVRLYRLRAFRYGTAAAFFIMASVVYLGFIASHAT